MLHFFYQCSISSKKLPYPNTVVYKYSCTIDFAYLYQINTSLGKTGLFFNLFSNKPSHVYAVGYTCQILWPHPWKNLLPSQNQNFLNLPDRFFSSIFDSFPPFRMPWNFSELCLMFMFTSQEAHLCSLSLRYCFNTIRSIVSILQAQTILKSKSKDIKLFFTSFNNKVYTLWERNNVFLSSIYMIDIKNNL